MIVRGCTRTVLLIGSWAVKVPSFRYGNEFRWRWRSFLNGLLANMQEVQFSETAWPELCPVRLNDPFGLLIIMPRVRIMTEEEFGEFDWRGFVTRGDAYAGENLRLQAGHNYRAGAEPAGLLIPAERKHDSFGWLDGRVVAVDYGN